MDNPSHAQGGERRVEEENVRHQTPRLLVQKFEPGNMFSFSDPSPFLAAALAAKPLDGLYQGHRRPA
jgi:hypothetical protein